MEDRAMACRTMVLAAIAIGLLSRSAWSQEKKVLDKTQSEWVKILEEHKEKRFRRAAVRALRQFPNKSEAALAALTKALSNDAEPDVRREIAVMLGELGQSAEKSVPVLAERLEKDTDPKVRAAAARSLGRLNKFAAAQVPKLALALQDADPNTRLAASEALVEFGEKASPALPQLAALAADAKMDAVVRGNAVRILGKLARDEKTAQLLGAVLVEKDAPLDLRLTTVTALGSMGPQASLAVPMLAETMENNKPGDKDDKEQLQQLRRSAGVALGKIGAKAKEALPAVMKVLDDPDLALKSQAIRLAGILGKGDPDVAGKLIMMLDKEKNAEVLVAV